MLSLLSVVQATPSKNVVILNFKNLEGGWNYLNKFAQFLFSPRKILKEGPATIENLKKKSHNKEIENVTQKFYNLSFFMK
jgi:hypothetical protein